MNLLNFRNFTWWDRNGQISIAVALIIILLLAIFIELLRSKLKKATDLSEFNIRVLAGLSSEQGIEKHLNQYLEMLIPFLEADGYYFYLFDSKSGNYVLRVSRQVGSQPGYNIAPSYSGLVPYEKEKYRPPLGLLGPSQAEGVSMIKDGEVPLVEITIHGGNGLIRIGPKHSLSKSTKHIFNHMGEILKPALTILMEIEKQKNDVELFIATSKAVNGLARSSYEVDSFRSKMLMLSTKMIDAGGCCLVVFQNDIFEVPIISGLTKEVEAQFCKDTEGLRNLTDLVKQSEYCHLIASEKGFHIVPLSLLAAGIQSILLFQVSGHTFKGVAIFWHYQIMVPEQHRIATVKMLVQCLGDLVDQQAKYEELSNSYIRALKSLMEGIDNLEPHTVGHSELIANYSVAIAKELGLSDQDVHEIKLAGYFHDVGMLGLSGDIFFKPGKYTNIEFETMKLHTEVGAALGESIIGNSKVASYIKYHHERWDGFGYPEGLRGEDIPLGARIISVADKFTAKLGGRKYREPATFERAINDLMAASGAQLDPRIVEALLNWFRKKQSAQKRSGRTLGPCWEMRCCPPAIRQHCIAYQKTDKNCWEFKGVNCAAHGNSCATCFVHTEAQYRANRDL